MICVSTHINVVTARWKSKVEETLRATRDECAFQNKRAMKAYNEKLLGEVRVLLPSGIMFKNRIVL